MRKFSPSCKSTLLIVTLLLLAATARVTAETKNKPLVIAHRGASGYVAEHTVVAVAIAHAMQADYIEQDVVLTSDNRPIVLHDIRLGAVTNVAKKFPNRKRTDGYYYAIDFTLAEIKQLRVNERINLKTGKAVYPGRVPENQTDLRPMALVEEIQLIQALNKGTGRSTGLYVEIKHPAWHRKQGKDISRIVLATLAKHGYEDHDDKVYVQCFEGAETRRLREELKTRLKLVQLIGNANYAGADLTDWDAMCTAEGLTQLAKHVDGVGPSLQRVVAGSSADGKPEITDFLKLAHEAGLEVHPFTFRKDDLPAYAESFEELLEIFADVDGVFTDFPDLAVEWRQQGNE